MEQLAELAKELGTPGQAKLYRAAKKKGIPISEDRSSILPGEERREADI